MSFFNYQGNFGIVLNTVTIACLLCYALTLFIKRDRTLPQVFLAFTLIVVSITCKIRFFVYDNYLDVGKGEFLHSVNLSGSALVGVLILSCFISLMQPRMLTLKYFMCWLSAVLAFAVALFTADALLDNPPLSLHEAIEHPWRGSVIVRFLGGTAVLLLEIYIAYAVISMYIRHRKFIRQCYSYEEQINLRWVTWSIVCFGIFAVVALIRHTYPSDTTKILFNVGALLPMTCIYVLYFRQGTIPTADELTDFQTEKKEEIPANNLQINRQQQRQNKLEDNLTYYFTEQKPYLNPELSLPDVAKAIGVNTTSLSQLINRRLNANFFDFVNRYRIDYAIRLIHEKQGDITSEMLYIEAGFKSRSVFYRLFRERTGLSPQAYIRRIDPVNLLVAP